MAAPMAFAAKTPQPAVRLTFESLGMPNVSSSFLEAGYSMLTAHFVDSSHLLVTYSLRGLVERIEGDPPGDDDRAVAALLLELPSGKVLARARWHLHDHAQYIWALGDGRFLLRNRSVLTAFAPLANLASGEAFRMSPFLHPTGQIDGLLISPEGDLVTLESSPRRREAADTKAGAVEEERLRRGSELFSFARVEGTGGPGSPILAVSAGLMRAAHSGLLPLNARGYLLAKESARSRWKIEYEGFDGGAKTLEYLDSSCPPTLQFVSPGQYVAFSCRGADDKIMVSAFDFAPHEMWEEPMGSSNAFVRFAYAPQSGRFVLSRMVSSLSSVSGGGPALQGAAPPPVSDPGTMQEVRVYQTESGDLLFKMSCTPVLRAGQNFDITPDGTAVLMVRGGALEIYKLPSLSGRDRKELAEAQAFEPAMAKTTRVEFRRMLKEATAEAVEAKDLEPENTPVVAVGADVVAPVEAAAPPVAEQRKAVVENGDEQTVRRAPPSLLNPGETTDSGKKPK